MSKEQCITTAPFALRYYLLLVFVLLLHCKHERPFVNKNCPGWFSSSFCLNHGTMWRFYHVDTQFIRSAWRKWEIITSKYIIKFRGLCSILKCCCIYQLTTPNYACRYACPLCSKSVCDMSKVWEKFDMEIAATPMPEPYQNRMVSMRTKLT